jgi:hypothetical protein
MIHIDDIHKQLRFGRRAVSIRTLITAQCCSYEVEKFASEIMKQYSVSLEFRILYENRLRYGLQQYFLRHYRPAEVDEAEE